MVILGKSGIFTPGLRFLPLFLDWPFSSRSPFYHKNLVDRHLKIPSTLCWFFLPDSQFSPLLTGSLPIGHFTRDISPSFNKICVNLCMIFYLPFSPFLAAFRRLNQIRHLTRDIAPIVLWSFAMSIIVTLPVRFSPFFPDCHFTRDISRAFCSISATW